MGNQAPHVNFSYLGIVKYQFNVKPETCLRDLRKDIPVVIRRP